MLSGLKPGTVVDDRYEIVEHLGDGGMGSVFKAKELGLERFVALKMLHPSLVGDEEHRKRFKREGAVLATLEHPHILQCYRFGMWQATYPYISMEYVVGQSLSSLIAENEKLPVDRMLTLGLQISAAMDHAHQHHVVHRDLKPANIMILLGEKGDCAKVLDFGLARVLSDSGNVSQQLTQSGCLVGSVYYMSPEQCLGKKADGRSDIYSLGCLLYEVLTGAPPLMADNPMGLIYLHVNSMPDSLDKHFDKTELPAGLNDSLMRAMAKNPEDRFQSMKEFHDALCLVQEGGASDAEQSEFATKTASQNWTKGIVAFVSIILVVSVVQFFKSTGSEMPDELSPLTVNSAGHVSGDAAGNIGAQKAPVLDEGSLTLERLRQSVERAERLDNIEKTAEGNERVVLFVNKLTALRSAYWSAGRFDDWYALNGKISKCNARLSNGKTRQADHLAEAYHCCYLVGRTAGREHAQTWMHRANEAVQQLRALARERDNPYAKLILGQVNCIALSRKGRFDEAKEVFFAAWPPPKLFRANSVMTGTETKEDWRAKSVERTVEYLMLEPRWKNREEALTLCEIIVPMATYLEKGKSAVTATRSKLFCRRLLNKAYVLQPGDPAIQQRLSTVYDSLNK